MMSHELNNMETILENNMDKISYTAYNIFKCHVDYGRFCLTWRTGGILILILKI